MTIEIISIDGSSTTSNTSTSNPKKASTNPLNPLSRSTRTVLGTTLQKAIEDDAITSIVLHGGQNFSAGADISEFGTPEPESTTPIPSITELCEQIESSPKPIIALITGFALGGGCELALACHYRVAVEGAKFGLPEVKIGLIPGAGGTQRLTRLCRDVGWTLEVITSGRTITTTEAKTKHLIDYIIPHTPSATNPTSSPLPTAQKWATYATLLSDLTHRRTRNRNVLLPTDPTAHSTANALCDHYLQKRIPPKARGGQAAHAAVEAIRASFRKGSTFEEGMEVEAEYFWDLLLNGVQGRALRYAFFAGSGGGGGRRGGRLGETAGRLVKGGDGVCVGVVGAGTMGSGIAVCFLRAGYRVILLDSNEGSLARGNASITKIITQDVTKGRMTKAQAFKILQHNFTSGCDMSSPALGFANCALVIEAVFENLDVKRSIFTELNTVITNPHALLLSNTSTLSIDSIISVLPPSRREYCAGMHFFSPAHVMKLVEIVKSSHSSVETITTLQTIVKRKLGKVGVVVGNCEGFVGNRMIGPYSAEAVFVLQEGGASVSGLDGALSDFGMAIGPQAMGDLAGNDIGYLIRKSKGLVKDPKTGAVPLNRRGRRDTDLADDLVVRLGRVGQKAGKGWYDYDVKIGRGRKGIPSEEVAKFIASYSTTSSPTPTPYAASEIVERLLFPLVNEGFKILEEGIAQSPSDIDLIYLYGYGWPSWRGGPMYWANMEVGLAHVLKRLEEMDSMFPGSTHYVPSKLLRECVGLDVTVMEYYEKGLGKSKGLPSAKL